MPLMSITQPEVQQWFSAETLTSFLGPAKYHADEIARWFLLRRGHRWRPFLCIGAYQAMTNDLVTLSVWKCALAIECFHKASMIHDDIEDDDKPDALHKFTGLAIALNAGDLLIHHAYALLSGCYLPADKIAGLIAIASRTQRQLCFGQGEELNNRGQSPLLKTAPLFELAFHTARICCRGHTHSITSFIEPFCQRLGDAYQALDDLRDGTGSELALRDKVSAARDAVPFFAPLHYFLTDYLALMFTQATPANESKLLMSTPPSN